MLISKLKKIIIVIQVIELVFPINQEVIQVIELVFPINQEVIQVIELVFPIKVLSVVLRSLVAQNSIAQKRISMIENWYTN